MEKLKFIDNPEIGFSIKVLIVFIVISVCYIFVSVFIFRIFFENNLKKTLDIRNKRVIEDIIYKNGEWDTTRYVNDFDIDVGNDPLYITTLDGFIIDRYKSIKGFLDTSDYKYSSSFITPKTIKSPVNEVWRIYSKEIKEEGTPIGVIVVGYLRPEEGALKQIDEQLKRNANIINSKLIINKGKIDSSNIDIRDVDIEISLEIVDKYNRTIQSIGGLPSYLDRSYLSKIQLGKFETLEDEVTKENFLIYSKPILNNSGENIGIVVSGMSLAELDNFLKNQVILSIILTLLFSIAIIAIINRISKREVENLGKKAIHSVLMMLTPPFNKEVLRFDEQNGTVRYRDKSIYFTKELNQYCICKIIFSKSLKKVWNNDEIFDGLPPSMKDFSTMNISNKEKNSRIAKKVNDAIRLINKKSVKVFDHKLIISEPNTHHVNPLLYSLW